MRQTCTNDAYASVPLTEITNLMTARDLLPGILHDVINKVTGISNYAQLLSEQMTREDSGIVNRIIYEGECVSALVSLFSHVVIARQTENENPGIKSLSDGIRLLGGTCFQKFRIGLDVEIADDLPLTNSGKKVILQVILHLLAKAGISLSHNRPVSAPWQHIIIRAARTEPENRKTGQLNFIYDSGNVCRYLQIKLLFPLLLKAAPGTPLGDGLRVCRHLLEGVGGTIQHTHNSPDQTNITIELPATAEGQ